MDASMQGEQAPDFELVAADGRLTALSDLRGSPVVLAFYPADRSSVCGDQITIYDEVLADFERLGARILGVSDARVARLYGVYRESDGATERALVAIDADGLIRWQYIALVGVNPGTDGILAGLEALAADASK